MIFIFVIFIFLLLLSNNFYKNEFNENYLSKDNTTKINGIFILLVFFSHFLGYIAINNSYDALISNIVGSIGQLIVTTFFFFSGYGIHESVKKKGEPYINNFFRHRFMPVYINWFFAILAFLAVNLLMQNTLTVQQVALSFIGWESIGNSNWYLFDIFMLYIFFIISFNLFKKEKMRIYGLTFLTILFIFSLYFLKDGYWYSTVLCFPLGMFYSYYKDRIDNAVMKSNKKYILSFASILVLFVISLFVHRMMHNDVLFNITSCLFVLLISIWLMKFEFKSKILYWCGKNLFWIYILQRIPMMIFKDVFSNYDIYFIVCFVITIIFVLCINNIKQRIDKRKHTSMG